MDYQKICECLRICVALAVGVLCALLVYAPARADVPPPDNEFRVNSVGINSGELPAPLPTMPDPIDMPNVEYPYVDRSAWPTTVDEREAMKTLVENRVYRLQGALNTQYSRARSSVSAVRETTNAVRNFVGDPMAMVSTGAERSVTVGAMAQEMAQSTSFALGYARAVSSLGPLGLDLVFLFVGLGWVIFVNLISMLIQVVAWFIRMMGNALDWIFKVLLIVIQLIRLVIDLVDLIWPF